VRERPVSDGEADLDRLLDIEAREAALVGHPEVAFVHRDLTGANANAAILDDDLITGL
jgi:hypothetical protein